MPTGPLKVAVPAVLIVSACAFGALPATGPEKVMPEAPAVSVTFAAASVTASA